MDGTLKKTQLSVAISILLMSRVSGATDFVVDTIADTVAPDGKLSLREAIQTANSNTPVNEDALPGDIDGDTISFDPGLFLSSQTISLAQGQLEITDDLTINGPSGPAEAIIDAQLASRHLEINSRERVQINNLSLQNGKDNGATVLLSEGGNLILQNVSISGCTAEAGGAIYGMGTITITGSTISGNTAGQEDGGPWNSATGNMTITGTTISGNTANAAGSSGGQGGSGVFNNGGTSTVLNSTVSGNTANAANSADGQGGGGVFNNSGTISLRNSGVMENVVTGVLGLLDGGGVDTEAGTLTVVNSTVSGNTAGNSGGGLNIGGSTQLDLQFTTVAYNTASEYDGGMMVGGGSVYSSLFAYNGAVKGHDIYGAVDVMSYSIISNSDSLTIGSALSNQLDVNPLIRALADNGGPTPSHALQPGSPAIDKGDPQNCPGTDQRLARRIDGLCDAGAY